MLKPGIAATLLACCLALGLAPLAQADETFKITEAGFSPNLTGVPTNAFGKGEIGTTTGAIPSPITHVNVFGPAGTTLDLEGTGTCNAEELKNIGPEACPADSKAGFGGGEGTYEIAHEVVNEPYTLDFFLGNNKPGHIEVLIYLKGSSPVSIELVFTANVVTGPKPYGLGFSLNVPLIKVLPEASDASAKTAFLTLGAKNVAYYKKVHGRKTLEHVRGIVTPKTCPRGGWPVETQLTFEDGSTVTAKRSVPCRKK
ncbi:MAG TPA: hypothetical protein VMG62_01585 [Solirubrobacteraceae bacterium]|nr:hypothetical protein [Solirubrobacteraceae bacterium]